MPPSATDPRPEKPPSRPGASSRRTAAARSRGERAVRRLAQSTLFAAGLAAGYMGLPEFDPRFHLFDPTLVDRLEAPLTRHHD